MSTTSTRIDSTASLLEAVDLMAHERRRRLMVVDSEGHALGVLEADDLVRLLGREIAGLVSIAAAQIPGQAVPPMGLPISIESEHAEKRVVELTSDTPVIQAIEEMRRAGHGCVVVTDGEGEPVGMVTDRDIAVRLVARGKDPQLTVLSAIMSSPVVTCESTEPAEELVAKMQEHGIRRIPITRRGRLTGIVSFDDLLVTVGSELQRLGASGGARSRSPSFRTRRPAPTARSRIAER